MTKKTVLFVFEGEKTEPRYLQLFIDKTAIFDADSYLIYKLVYGNTIYDLYKELEQDKDLGLIGLLKEREQNKKREQNEKIKNINRRDIAEIYLFFDYDGHHTTAKDGHIKEMLEYFNNETNKNKGKGKLFISYPMTEALRHQSDAFNDLTSPVNQGVKYKERVGVEGIQDLRKLSKQDFEGLCDKHIKKANYLVYNKDEYPNAIIKQNTIFSAQKTKHINPHQEVSVLSGFPLLYLNYLGAKDPHHN